MTITLGESTWVDIPNGPIVLVPLGSTEQHGPHLPMTTDALIAESVAAAAAARMSAADGGTVVVAPVLAYGASGEHQDFAGTVSIGHEALRVVLIEMVRSLSTWAGRIVFVSAHGGNAPTVAAVIEQMRGEGHQVGAAMCVPETPTDAHAGFDETCVMLHLHPSLVRMDRAEPGNTKPLKEILPDLMTSGIRPSSPTGVLGDPTAATAGEGRVIFDQLVERAVQEVQRD